MVLHAELVDWLGVRWGVLDSSLVLRGYAELFRSLAFYYPSASRSHSTATVGLCPTYLAALYCLS